MNYANAPATKLLATHCAVCARPLLDAVSVESGIGPDCRRKHGYTTAQGEPDWAAVEACVAGRVETSRDVRALANALVHRIAVHQTGADVLALVNALAALGFAKLATRIGVRLAKVEIREEGTELVVDAPYEESALTAWSRVPGRRWDREAKVQRIAATPAGRRAVWSVLQRHYAGLVAVGPKGLFQICA